jgi:hypothetical protein
VTISVVQTKTVGSGYSGSFAGNVTAGNAVVLCVSAFHSTFDTISTSNPVFNGGSVSGSAKLAEVQQGSGGVLYTAIWIMPNVAGGAASFGITVSGQTNIAGAGLVAYEVSGLGTAPTLDTSSTGQNTSGTAMTSGASGAIAAAPELIVGAYACNGGTASDAIPGAPWTSSQVSGTGVGVAGYQVALSSGGTYTYSATQATSNPWSAAVTAIAPGSGTAHTTTAAGTMAMAGADGKLAGRNPAGQAAFSGVTVKAAARAVAAQLAFAGLAQPGRLLANPGGTPDRHHRRPWWPW